MKGPERSIGEVTKALAFGAGLSVLGVACEMPDSTVRNSESSIIISADKNPVKEVTTASISNDFWPVRIVRIGYSKYSPKNQLTGNEIGYMIENYQKQNVEVIKFTDGKPEKRTIAFNKTTREEVLREAEKYLVGKVDGINYSSFRLNLNPWANTR